MDSNLHKELKACRFQLQQATRRAAAAQESRDELGNKLNETMDEVAELSRQLDVATHQRGILAREVATKDAALAKAAKEQSSAESSLSLLKLENARGKESLQKCQADLVAQTKATGQLEAALAIEKNQSSKLQRTVDALTAEQCALKRQYNELQASFEALQKEFELANVQSKAREAVLASTHAALQQAQREAGEAGRVKQALKDSTMEAAELRKELRHLEIELLREQAAAEDVEAQRAVQGAALSHREEGINNHDNNINSNKVALLQKRCIAQREEVAALSALVQEKDQEIAKLQKSLGLRMEGDELQKELSRVRGEYNSKVKQLQAAKAEIVALHSELEAERKTRKKAAEESNQRIYKDDERTDGQMDGGDSEYVAERIARIPLKPRSEVLPLMPSQHRRKEQQKSELDLSPIVTARTL